MGEGYKSPEIPEVSLGREIVFLLCLCAAEVVRSQVLCPSRCPSPAACSCHPVGSAVLPLGPHTFCDPSTGDCPCKPGVAGPRCDHCLPGYWGFSAYGCRPCDCARSCDPLTGDCHSSRWVGGPTTPHQTSLISVLEKALSTPGKQAGRYPLCEVLGVWYGQEVGIEWELRLWLPWVSGTPWQGTSNAGIFALSAGVNVLGVFHNLHSCSLSTSKMWASGTSE